MKTLATLVVLLAFSLLAPWCRSEDWLVKGRTYRNIQVIGVNPDTVSVLYRGGTGRFALADLSPELQAKYKDDAALATEATTDPIAHLVVSLRTTNGMWVNGISPMIRLPANATTDQVLPAALQPYERSQQYRFIRIEKVEQVKIDPWPGTCTAVLVHGDPSDKIVLLQYMNENVGWISKVFDSGW